MPCWRDLYLSSIHDAEESNPVNSALVAACSQLQDRISALLAEKVTLTSLPKTYDTGASPPQPSPGHGSKPSPSPSSDVQAARLRLELAEVLRSQGQLQSRLGVAEEELDALRGRTKADTKTIRTLTVERNALVTKVRDRDEELRGKSKLVENVQDEHIALTLQLNIAEQQRARVQAENRELIARWMKQKGQEAEAMNRDIEPKP